MSKATTARNGWMLLEGGVEYGNFEMMFDVAKQVLEHCKSESE